MPSLHKLAANFSESQSRAITAPQARALGISASWIKHKIDSGLWQRAYRGVYVTHSGPLDWQTRAFAAVLSCGRGAYLSHETAWFMHGLNPSAPRFISVSVPGERYVTGQPGIKVYRRKLRIGTEGVLARSIPEETALDLITQTEKASDIIGILTAGVRGPIHPTLLLRALDKRKRFKHRGLIMGILADIEDGVESPLEHLYDELERNHGLPRSSKQMSDVVNGIRIRADRVFEDYFVHIELDGELAHPGGRTNLDTWRDNAVMVKSGTITLRYRWNHIVGSPCATAAQIAAALQSRGWRGTPTKCGPTCKVTKYQIS